jgi:hypothetical protein
LVSLVLEKEVVGKTTRRRRPRHARKRERPNVGGTRTKALESDGLKYSLRNPNSPRRGWPRQVQPWTTVTLASFPITLGRPMRGRKMREATRAICGDRGAKTGSPEDVTHPRLRAALSQHVLLLKGQRRRRWRESYFRRHERRSTRSRKSSASPRHSDHQAIRTPPATCCEVALRENWPV